MGRALVLTQDNHNNVIKVYFAINTNFTKQVAKGFLQHISLVGQNQNTLNIIIIFLM